MVDVRDVGTYRRQYIVHYFVPTDGGEDVGWAGRNTQSDGTLMTDCRYSRQDPQASKESDLDLAGDWTEQD